MSVLRVNQIKASLLALFEKHLDLTDLSPKDPEREIKVLTRCLAAFAIYSEAGCTEKEAADALWDGGDDNGIDAAFYDSSDSRVIFVQSKFIQKGSGEPAAAEIGSFTKGVRDVIENEVDLFHPRLHSKLSDLAVHINTAGTKVHVVVISTGASELAKHAQGRVDDLVSELNGNDLEPVASAAVVGLADVFGRLANDPGQASVTLDATILDWSLLSHPYPAYFGVIDGLTLKGWWLAHGQRVFSANIRHALGSTEVNNEIRLTALNTPERFWYFNNGITLIADEASKAPAAVASRSAGVFSLKGASVVNGAQTISSLARVLDDARLAEVRVPIRVILLKTAPAEFGSEVTRTNNLQNRIESRDFVAQDAEQKRLRQEMGIEHIDYQFVRSEEATPNAASCDLIEVTTALACASSDATLAVFAKTGVSSRFFTDLTKAPYKTIFNPSLSGAKAYNAVLVSRVVESWIDAKKKASAKKSGPNWGVLVHGNRILAAAVFAQMGTGKLEKPIASFSKDIASLKIEAICEKVYAKILEVIQVKYSNNLLGVLFKNATISKDIYALTK